MSADCYQIAFEQATREITEINAQLEKLTRRKALLGNLIAPLERLVSGAEDPGLDFATTETGSEDSEEAMQSDVKAISDDEVARLAYYFWSERGQVHGFHEEDWRRAAQELQNPAY